MLEKFILKKNLKIQMIPVALMFWGFNAKNYH